jgi:hypothetical protein
MPDDVVFIDQAQVQDLSTGKTEALKPEPETAAFADKKRKSKAKPKDAKGKESSKDSKDSKESKDNIDKKPKKKSAPKKKDEQEKVSDSGIDVGDKDSEKVQNN